MENDLIFRIVRGQQLGIDNTLTYLSGLKGAAGLIGFDRFATELSDAENARDSARGEVGRVTAIIDVATRKYFKLDDTAPVQPEQREEFRIALMAAGEDAGQVIVGKGDAPRTSDDTTKEALATLAESLKELQSGTNDITHLNDFAGTLHSTYREAFNKDASTSYDAGAVAWARKAATFLKDVKTAHSKASVDEKDAMVWAKERLTSPR